MAKSTIKLSELNDDDMILVGDDLVMRKECYIREKDEHVGVPIFSTTSYTASIDAKDMIECAIDMESGNMFEDWCDEVMQELTNKDIEDLQVIVDRILNRGRNITYYAGKEIVDDTDRL